MNIVERTVNKLKLILEFFSDYDWEEVLKYTSNVDAVTGPTEYINNSPFTKENIVQIIAKDEGENDGAYWIVALKLNDGRYAFLQACCDYTGWG